MWYYAKFGRSTSKSVGLSRGTTKIWESWAPLFGKGTCLTVYNTNLPHMGYHVGFDQQYEHTFGYPQVKLAPLVHGRKSVVNVRIGSRNRVPKAQGYRGADSADGVEGYPLTTKGFFFKFALQSGTF